MDNTELEWILIGDLGAFFFHESSKNEPKSPTKIQKVSFLNNKTLKSYFQKGAFFFGEVEKWRYFG